MSLVLYIFIFYIIISLLSRIGNKKRRSHGLMRKEEDKAISIFSEIQEEAGSPEEKTNIKQVDNIEKKDKIIIGRESGLEIYLSDNILVNGIILSEIIAPPRALRPYDFKRYKR